MVVTKPSTGSKHLATEIVTWGTIVLNKYYWFLPVMGAKLIIFFHNLRDSDITLKATATAIHICELDKFE